MSIRIRKGARRKRDAKARAEANLRELEARADHILSGEGSIGQVGNMRGFAAEIEETSAVFSREGNVDACVRLHKLAERFRARADEIILIEAAKIKAVRP